MKIKSCTVLIRSAPSFFELTYMLLQNNYVNNGETTGVKEKKGKKHVKQLYMVNKKSHWLQVSASKLLGY